MNKLKNKYKRQKDDWKILFLAMKKVLDLQLCQNVRDYNTFG